MDTTDTCLKETSTIPEKYKKLLKFSVLYKTKNLIVIRNYRAAQQVYSELSKLVEKFTVKHAKGDGFYNFGTIELTNGSSIQLCAYYENELRGSIYDNVFFYGDFNQEELNIRSGCIFKKSYYGELKDAGFISQEELYSVVKNFGLFNIKEVETVTVTREDKVVKIF